LWYSGPGISMQPLRAYGQARLGWEQSPGHQKGSASDRPGSTPPDVGAFQVRAGPPGASGSSLSPGIGPAAGGPRDPPRETRSASTPTTRAGSATSNRIAVSSRPGRAGRDRLRDGAELPAGPRRPSRETRPNWAGAIVTRSSGTTPAAANARARRLLRRSSSPRVTAEPPTVTAGRSGIPPGPRRPSRRADRLPGLNSLRLTRLKAPAGGDQ